MKRNIIIVIVVIVVAAGILGLGIFLRSQQQIPAPTDTGGPAGGLPVTQPGSSQPNTSTGTVTGNVNASAALTPNSVVDYYVDGQGNVFAVELDGQISMSNKTRTVVDASHIGTVLAALFSPDGTKAAVELAVGSSAAQWNIFDFQKRSWLPVAVSAVSAAWSPDSSALAYDGSGAQAGTIAVLSFKGAAPSAKTILRLSALDMTLQWPSAERLILAERSAAATRGSVWGLNPVTGSFTPLLQDGQGIEFLAGPGAGLLFQAGTVRGGTLALTDTSGQKIAALSFLTLPSKCNFWLQDTSTSTQTSYLLCAIPRNTQSLALATLPDQYQQRGAFTSDGFYKISVSTGKVTTIMNDPAQNFDATNLKVFGTSSLYFVNRVDQKVYKVGL